ncbi:MAG: iron-sulfur cluster assembly scaffold protein [Actinomycetales bacterium]|nr:iron-sulfur cluster assembly scaffold protein [Actinomycetales bacterium]
MSGGAAPLSDAERAEAIEALARAATGAGPLPEGPDWRRVERRTPACGDRVTLAVRVVDDRVEGLVWDHRGCTVSRAGSAGVAALALGRGVGATRELLARHVAAVAPEGVADPALGELALLAGIGRFPLRAGCATLAARALEEALTAGASA